MEAIPQRYAPGSVKLNEAKPSTLGEIKLGDQVRALGTKSEDGSFQAEKLVFGTFHNLNVTVLSVDLQSRSMTAKDFASGQIVLVRTNENSTFHRLSPDASDRYSFDQDQLRFLRLGRSHIAKRLKRESVRVCG